MSNKMTGIIRKNGLLKLLNLFTLFLILISILLTMRSVFSLYGNVGNLGLKEDRKIEDHPKEEGKALSGYSHIFGNNPFGFKEEGSGKAVIRDKGYVSKELRLIGTISNQEGKGFAVFMNADGRQEIFSTGADVFSMGSLVKVGPDSAEIRGERRIEIPIVEIQGYADTQRGRGGAQRQYDPGYSTDTEFIKRTSNGEYIVDRRRVDEAIQNPQQLMTDARLQPVFNGGKQNGFMLREVRRGGLYYNLGLRNNDTLLRINEYSINDPESALHAFNALRGADMISLDIIRNGSRETIRYFIR